MSEYETLKELLLHQEREAIEQLRQQFAELLQETHDHELIVQRLTPVISDLLQKTIANSSDEIAKVMAPIMGDAIKEQVKTQKKTIVDALYPVIGNMIAKFVSNALKETLDEINTKVQNNLSFTAIKRKITAKIKGVSESELLLQESSFGSIERVFLIHTESGLLLWQGSRDNKELLEAEMLSAMLSAIRSFANDWVAYSDDAFELHTIDYGDSKIYLEVSGSCYLAVVIQGDIRTKMQEQITTVFSEMLEEHGERIGKFEGDTAMLDIDAIAKSLQRLFIMQTPDDPTQSDTKNGKKFLSILLLSLLALFGYLYYRSYRQEHYKELLTERLARSPELNLYKLDVDVGSDTITLRGTVPNERLKALAQELAAGAEADMTVVNDIVVAKLPTTPEAIASQLHLFDTIFNLHKGVAIASQLENGSIILSGNVTDPAIKTKIVESYKKIDGVDRVLDTIRVRLPRITEKIFFKTGQTDLDEMQKRELDEIISKYALQELSRHIKGTKLLISAHTDGIGDMRINEEYAMKRAESVKNYLTEHGVSERFLQIYFSAKPPQGFTASDDPGKARVALFSWSKKQ